MDHNERKQLLDAEDTEDLILQQEKFLRSGKAPAAKVVRVPKPDSGDRADIQPGPVLDKDVVRIGQLPATTPDLSRQAQPKSSLFKQSRAEASEDVAHRMRVGDRHITHVMTQIVEREHVLGPIVPPAPRDTSFPPVKHRSERTFKRPVTRQPAPSVISSAAPSNDRLFADVDAENTAKLGNMSASEISALQQEIHSSIDPRLVARLKLRGEARLRQETSPKKANNAATSDMTRVNRRTDPDEVIDLANRGFVYDTRDTLTADTQVSNIDLDEKQLAEALEREKVRWMTPVTPTDTRTSTRAEQLRYDFAGRPVTGVAEQYDAALYHHGEAPDQPGYTLQELIHLLSSTVKKQRALAVHVIANIVQNWKQLDDQSRAAELLTWAIEQKLPLLVRRVLDEGPEALISDSLRALHALVVNPRDEEIYAEMSLTWRGDCIWPLISEHVPVSEDEHVTDAEQVQRDLVPALLHTGLLTRLRYLVEVLQPGHAVVELVLDLLLACTRHSETGVNHVLSCPRLLTVIVRNFVHVTREDGPYRPHPKALQLLQRCCQATLDTCQRFLGLLPPSPLLLNQDDAPDPRADADDLNAAAHGILPLVIAYFVRPPRDLSVHPSLSALTVQTLRLWNTCVRYGLTSELYLDIYHVIIEHINHLQTKKEILSPDTARVSTALFIVLEGLLEIAVVNSSVNQGTSGDQGASDADQSRAANQGPALQWSHLSALFHPTLQALAALLTAVDSSTRDFAEIREHVTAVAAILHFMASYFKHLKQLPEDHVAEVRVAVQQLSHVIAKYVAPLTKSKLFRLAVEHATQLSNSAESHGSVALAALPCLTWSCQTPTSIAAQNAVHGATRLLNMVMALVEDYNHVLDDAQSQVQLTLDAPLVHVLRQLLTALLDAHVPLMPKYGKSLDKSLLPRLFTHVPSTRLMQSLVLVLNLAHRQQISADLPFMKDLPSLAMQVADHVLPGDELLVLELFEHVILNRGVYLLTRDHVLDELSRRPTHSVKRAFSEQDVIMSQLDQHRDALVQFIDFYFGLVLGPYELPLDTSDTESRAFILTRDFVTRGQLTHVIGLDKSVLPLNGTWLCWPLHYAHRMLSEAADSTERDELLHEFLQHFMQQYIRVTCFWSIHNARYFAAYPREELFLELGRLFLLGTDILHDPLIDSMAAHVIASISARGELALDTAGPTTSAKLGDIAEIWVSEGAGGQALATWLLTALPAQCASQVWSTLATAWHTLATHVTQPIDRLVGGLTMTRVKEAMAWLAAPQITAELRESNLYWALIQHVTRGVFSEALGDAWARQQQWSYWLKSRRPVQQVVHDVIYFWSEREPVQSRAQIAEQPPQSAVAARVALVRAACEDQELAPLMRAYLPDLFY